MNPTQLEEVAIMSKINNQRRLLLRSAVALCGALCLPAVGKTSQSLLSKQASKTPGQHTDALELAAEMKVSKTQIKYQDRPKGDQMCATCQQFITPHSCKLVEGKISPSGWCLLWTQKTA